MSHELENIKNSVMNKIHDDKIKMKPKMYFILGSVLTFLGLVGSIVISTFLFGLIRFSVRAHGPMSQYRLNELISNFPWWTSLFAILFLALGIWLIHKYEFSYKKNYLHIVIGFILAIIIAGWVIDIVGINDKLSRRGPMQGMMRGYMKSGGIQINR